MKIKQITLQGKKFVLHCMPTANAKRWICKPQGQAQIMQKIITLLQAKGTTIQPNSSGQLSIFANSLESLSNQLFKALLRVNEPVNHVDIIIPNVSYRFAWWPEERQLQYFCFDNTAGVPNIMLSRLEKERKKYTKIEPINYAGVRVAVRVSLHQRISLPEAIEHLISCKE